MDKNNYSKTEDFILDDSFARYVMSGEDPDKSWDAFIKENPELSLELDTAKQLIKYLNSANKLPVKVDKQEELSRLLQEINKPVRRIKLAQHLFKYAAAILILISSISLLELHEVFLYKEYNAKDGNRNIVLSDGTLIDLRKGSSLKVSRFYEILNRDVELEGEAFFNVYRDKNSRFVVQLNTSKVTVLGTAFNIRSYPDSAVVSVKEGKVSFQSDKEGEEVILTKKMSGLCNSFSEFQTRKFNINKMGWSTGEFHFTNQSLSHILKQLETYYPVHFYISDKYNNKSLSFHVSEMELNDVLALLNQIVPEIEIERENQIITIK
jgi:ferric-dicitrate binding protein FerR (iron transport regulator)